MKKSKTFFCLFTLLLPALSQAKSTNSPLKKDVTEDLSSFEESGPFAELKVFAESLNIIEKYYPQKTSRKKTIPSAVRGLLFELDPYSHFMEPDEIKKFKNLHQQHPYKLGIETAFQNKKLVITSVYKNSPADKKKLKPGDIITHINGAEVKNKSFGSLSRELKGGSGQRASFLIQRKGEKKPLLFRVAFKNFRVPSIESRFIEEKFFYIRIFSFKKSTYKDFKRDLKTKKCRRRPKSAFCQNLTNGILIDLRGNSGGLIDQALLIADLFISKGILVEIKGRKPSENRVFKAKPLSIAQKSPLFVLMDKYSASASEILAGALRGNKRALILGEKSFGKGSVQTIFNLHKGYALKLTVGKYYTPLGVEIENNGILPDISWEKIFNPLSSVKEAKTALLNYKKQFNPAAASLPCEALNTNKKHDGLEKPPPQIKDLALKQAVALMSCF